MQQTIRPPLIQRNVREHPSFLNRLWRYQQERFPIFKHSLLIASFSFSAICLSALLRNEVGWPGWQSALMAFVSLLFFFLQLRLADEFKDFANDCRYRPERAVPRGLVTLEELRSLGIATIAIQATLVLFLRPALLPLLAAVWLYMALMRVEFGLSKWLQTHPFTYLWSHMLVVPLIDLFATACDWLPARSFAFSAPPGLGWFLLLSFCNGIAIEIGRKTWAPEQEREGVESYSSQWGIRRSITVWLAALGLALLCATILAARIHFLLPLLALLLPLLLLLSWIGIRFIRQPNAKRAKQLETLSGLWVASLYLVVGIVPMGVQVWLR